MIKEFVHQFCRAAKAAGIEKLNFYMEWVSQCGASQMAQQ